MKMNLIVTALMMTFAVGALGACGGAAKPPTDVASEPEAPEAPEKKGLEKFEGNRMEQAEEDE